MKGDIIALSVITREINSIEPFLSFLKNAQHFCHTISYLIIVYKSICNPKVISILQKHCNVICLKKGNCPQLKDNLTSIGLNDEEVFRIIGTPYLEKFNCVSYGTSRNYALVQAMLLKIDFLFFFDTDVFPKVLIDFRDGNGIFREIDFIGSHLKYLRTNIDIVVTTSDYTGFYIIPKMNFPFLDDLLIGIQKEDCFKNITNFENPVSREFTSKYICSTHKVLGGNLAIDLRKKELLPPFYSGMLLLNGDCYLGRGEDTLFAPIIEACGGRCVDIDLRIFHNCFGNFPLKPDIKQQENRDRFFLACMGWIIRNPFLNWIKKEYYNEENGITYKNRLESLKKGSAAAAEYFEDNRFLLLPEAFTKSLNNLPSEISRFKRLLTSWNKMIVLMKSLS